MKIKLKNLCKSFKTNDVLKNLNFEFESGNIYGLIGRNGSGKSVLLKVICGFYFPSSGEVLFNNTNYSSKNLYPPKLRALIEKPSFLPNLTGYQNLKLLSNIQNLIGDDEIIDTLKLVNLYEEKDKKYKDYSLGMKQKLGIAQVLMENPKILILDEPFNGIEEESVIKIKNILLKEKSKDKIIIISTHIKDDIKDLSDHILLLNNGNLEEKDKNDY